MCLGVCLPVCLCTHTWLMPDRLAKGTGFSGTAVTDSCDPLCGDADDSSQLREESHLFAPKHDESHPCRGPTRGTIESIFKCRAINKQNEKE